MSKCDDYFDDIVSETAMGGQTWEYWAELADFMEEIDFGCRFDESGGCQNAKKYNSSGYANNMCCCRGCAETEGYLTTIPSEALETIKREYAEDTGFWRSTGCALPRKWRSSVCLSFRCQTNDPYDEAVNDAWHALGQLYYWPKITIEEVRELMRKAGLLKDSH